jgi:predicted Zn-ribbon and HTH transcriptional regulator
MMIMSTANCNRCNYLWTSRVIEPKCPRCKNRLDKNKSNPENQNPENQIKEDQNGEF